MRRFIALLLLMLVPLQAAFGAAASYCENEKPQVTSHFGHHEHAGGDIDLVPSDEGKSPSADCQICHLASAHAAISLEVVVSGKVATLALSPLAAAPPDHPQHPFDRPPKSDLA